MNIVLDTNVLVAGLVTGNQVHFLASLCQEVKVFSPSEFLAFYRKSR